MLIYRATSGPKHSLRRAFTLVEMMVAVALVLLMMTMFAEIFSLATGSMSKQKALAELDQRQRLFSTVIRADIQSRTFSKVLAVHPAAGPFTGEPGYFYISENDLDDVTDDVLQFTVARPDGGSDPFYGKARQLLDRSFAGVTANPNQPENDDGVVDGFGSSDRAEVAYFLRNGTLYRRVLLIRNHPLSDGPMTEPPNPVSLIQPGIYPQGTGMTGTNYVSGGGTRFLADFDYSATYDYTANRLEFLGRSSLYGTKGQGNSLVLGLPSRRFGFRPTPNPVSSRPFEYLPSGDFIGRFTHEETSHLNFGFPGNPGLGPDGNYGTADDTNPYSNPSLALNLDKTVSIYANGGRQGEDILLTNVHAFDIKVWDDVMGDFVDIGHSGMASVSGTPTNGTYSQARNQNPAYGPRNAGNNRCFDTWHPNMNPLGALPPYVITNPAPYRPVIGAGPDGQPGRAGIDDDGNGTPDDNTEFGWPGSDDILAPMKAIQIRIQYRDVSSDLTRDVTIIESLEKQ